MLLHCRLHQRRRSLYVFLVLVCRRAIRGVVVSYRTQQLVSRCASRCGSLAPTYGSSSCCPLLSVHDAGAYRRKGYKNVKNMGDGALLGYTLAKTAAGVEKPLVKPDGQPTNEVHTFMPDLAPLAGEGMTSATFADPGAVLAAANARISAELGL